MARMRRVLLVEDRKESAQLYGRTIRAAGFDVDIATTSREAVDALENRAYDVAVVDMNLSGVPHDHSGGETVLRTAKATGDPIALVVLTAEDSTQLAADLIQDWGVSRFVAKSTITDQGLQPLLYAIDTALRGVSRSREHDVFMNSLAGGEPEPIWVDIALRTLTPKEGYRGLAQFLREFTLDLIPLLPAAENRVPLHLNKTRDALEGSFWSKGLGKAVAIRLESTDATAAASTNQMSLPGDVKIGDMVYEFERNSVLGRAWTITGAARSSFVRRS